MTLFVYTGLKLWKTMKANQIEGLSKALCSYILALQRAPTERELEIYIKNYMTALQKGKLLSANLV